MIGTIIVLKAVLKCRSVVFPHIVVGLGFSYFVNKVIQDGFKQTNIIFISVTMRNNGYVKDCNYKAIKLI